MPKGGRGGKQIPSDELLGLKPVSGTLLSDSRPWPVCRPCKSLSAVFVPDSELAGRPEDNGSDNGAIKMSYTCLPSGTLMLLPPYCCWHENDDAPCMGQTLSSAWESMANSYCPAGSLMQKQLQDAVSSGGPEH